MHCGCGVEWRMQLLVEKAGSYFETLLVILVSFFFLVVGKGPYVLPCATI